MPPDHPLCVNRSYASLAIEMYEDLYARQQQLTLQFAQQGAREVMAELNEVNEWLGEAKADRDDLVDQWERELAAGHTPDLDA